MSAALSEKRSQTRAHLQAAPVQSSGNVADSRFVYADKEALSCQAGQLPRPPKP